MGEKMNRESVVVCLGDDCNRDSKDRVKYVGAYSYRHF